MAERRSDTAEVIGSNPIPPTTHPIISENKHIAKITPLLARGLSSPPGPLVYSDRVAKWFKAVGFQPTIRGFDSHRGHQRFLSVFDRLRPRRRGRHLEMWR